MSDGHTGAQATRVRNHELDESLRSAVNKLLIKHLDGATTLAEMEMLSDRVFGFIDDWNGKKFLSSRS